MALNINGTTGISGVDGSVSAPAVTGTDSNTGITFPSADTIKFSTGGVERMSITNSGVSGTGIGAGKILQVLSTIKTDLYSQGTSGSFTDIPNLNVTITPVSTSSKIFVMVHLCHQINSNSDFAYRLLRGSTALGNSTVGSEGSRYGIACGTIDQNRGNPVAFNFLDSPNTTSATTYKVQVNHQNGSYRLNSRAGQWDGSSTITVMEVGQ